MRANRSRGSRGDVSRREGRHRMAVAQEPNDTSALEELQVLQSNAPASTTQTSTPSSFQARAR
jgi:hypothetical protein